MRYIRALGVTSGLTSACRKASLLATTALLVGGTGPAYARSSEEFPTAAAVSASAPADHDSSASADHSVAGDQDEIVVSAKRAGVSVQTMSAAVTVLGDAEITKLGIANTQDLQARVPSLVTSFQLGIPKVFLRGIGQESTTSGQEPGVATNVDGVYVGRSIQAYANQIDLDRVEVQRGPQGTLYGRNATAGTINYYTKRATSNFEYGANAGFGNLDSFKVGGFVNGALADGLNARVAVGFSDRDGYVKNLADGKSLDSYKVAAVHAAFNATPASNLEFNLSFEAQTDKSNGPSFLNISEPNPFLLPGAVAGRDYIVANGKRVVIEGPVGERLYTKRSGWAATLTTDWKPGAFNIRSITAYRHSLHRQYNGDPTIFPIINTTVRLPADQFSQEFNVSGEAGPVDYVFGALYFREHAVETDAGVVGYPAPAFFSPFFGQLEFIGYKLDQTTNSYAGFGDVTVKVVPGFRLLAGLRYSKDKKSVKQNNYFDYPGVRIDTCRAGADVVQPAGTTPAEVANSVSFSKWTGRVGAEADIADRTMAYATVSRGYKAGGFSDFAGCGPTFKPETVDSYEIGLKGSALDNRFTYRAAAFRMDYSNLQTQFTTVAGTTTVNAERARIKGVELELTARPSDRLSLDANVSYLDARYRDFLYPYTIGPQGLTPLQLAGDRMPRSPKWSGGAGIEYAHPLANNASLTARLEGYFTTNLSFNPAAYNIDGGPEQIQPGYALGNAYLTYDDGDGLTVRAFVKNFTNRFYLSSTLEFPILGNVAGFAAPPRTWGVEVSTRF